MDFSLYQEGYAFDAYRFFGAQVNDAKNGVTFRTHAPRAKEVFLIGEFSDWQAIPMQLNNGVWTVDVPQATEGMLYKFRIHGSDDSWVDHSDPYAFYSELRPRTASIIFDHTSYTFQDEKWMQNRNRNFDRPLNIYELHLGSWKTKVHELGEEFEGETVHKEEENWLTYKELVHPLVEYIKHMGFTHVELMPVFEHPFDASWGYQPSGFFSPTSRYGNPNDLKYFIDILHQNNIGVILDFVPVHFVADQYALARYDGEAFYEYPHPDVGYSEWGSHNFMHSKGEVRSFLASNAAYWLDLFHVDGLRYDAVSRLIFWHGDEKRGTIDHGIEFLKSMNTGLHRFFPEVMLIAEDSTDYPLVSTSSAHGGLDFDYKWNMGWMNDTLEFFELAPWERMHHYHKITFSMMYFYNENFLLAFSHDEVVHSKKTIIDKMFGFYDEKFAQAKALYLYMFAHPGKKLNFMGNEFAQFREWDEKREQDWDIAEYPIHKSFQNFFRELNFLYKNTKSMYLDDYDPAAFNWVIVNDEIGVVYAFTRGKELEKTFFIFNFSGQDYPYYSFDLGQATIKKELINTDWQCYSGQTPRFDSSTETWLREDNGRYAIHLRPFSGRAFLVDYGDHSI